ncbi:MAG: hypothetical protein LC789_12850 [Actinobacteria bacterium]|nr:hypothetical protein [Actinomycetota bacterium]
MLSSRLVRPLVALSLGVSVLGAGSALAAPRSPKLGPNLVVNGGFEMSTVQPVTDADLPVTPVGWTFEGAAVLFDYNNDGGHSGHYNARISGSLTPGAQLCDGSSGQDTCAANPAYSATGPLEQNSRSSYSIRPYWVTEKPLAVAAGKTYRFSTWAIRPSFGVDSGVPGEGAATAVRWVDAGGKGIAVTDGAKLVKGPKRALGFKLITADLKAPAGAVGAVLMLGHTDYLHTGAQVAFDDVTFQTVG